MEQWTICNKSGDFEGLEKAFGISAITARLLVNRGLTDLEEVRHFLNPDISGLHSPHLIKDMDRAAALIADRIAQGKKLRVVGDYDVDGIMATYILKNALTRCGAEAECYIPHRIKDGYGINARMIDDAADAGVDTVITCDNGIAAVAAAEEAKARGITLIVTDHHEIPDILPQAKILVDPKLPGNTYPCREICGAVVAAKLGQCLFELTGTDADITDYLEFMAMATVCDVVELKGENRTIAVLGMNKLKTTSNYGLAALIRLNELSPESISEYQLGYVLGPCFNATGRIDDASLALDLLEAATPEEADKYASECIKLNDERKVMTAKQEELAVGLIEEKGLSDRVIVQFLEDCHESILGIIAGRIKERYNRPTIMVTTSGENLKGSGRSIPAYNMFEELKGVGDLMLKYGGHPMAAGLSLKPDKFDEFVSRLNEQCTLTDKDMQRKLLIDAEVSFNLFTDKVMEELDLLAPFGQGNSAPLFAERGLKVKSMRYIGKENSFLRFTLVNSFGYEFTALYFADAAELTARLADAFGRDQVDRAFMGRDNRLVITAAYSPRVNDFKDRHEIQMNIKAVR